MKKLLHVICLLLVVISIPVSAKAVSDSSQNPLLSGFNSTLADAIVNSNSSKYVSDFLDMSQKIENINDVDLPNAAYAVAKAKYNPSLKYDVRPLLKDNTAYFFMPCTADINNLTITTYTSDNKRVRALENIDLSNDQTYYLRLNDVYYSVVVMQSDLPSLIFEINEDFGTIEAMNTCPEHDTKCFGDVILEVNDKVAEEKGWEGFKSVENDAKKKGTMEIKGRGNTTWTWYNKGSKLPYQFKLEKKTDVLGMGKHKTWIILKNDDFVVKNKLGLDLGIDLGIPYTSRSEFVDVFMNGEYLGLYLLCEKVEVGETRVNISDLDEEFEDNNNSTSNLDMSGGYLLEFDCWDDTLQIKHKLSNNTITIKSPEDLADTAVNRCEYEYITDLMNTWLDKIYTSGDASYLDYMNVPSFLNYFFHQEFLTNYDCGISSTYVFKDKNSIDPKLYAGPIWDSDRTFERIEKPTGWVVPNINLIFSTNPTLYNKLCSKKEFVDRLVNHYEKTNLPEILANAYKKIDVYTSDIGVSARMNSIRWDAPEMNIGWMKDFMITRAKWIDENYLTLYDFVK